MIWVIIVLVVIWSIFISMISTKEKVSDIISLLIFVSILGLIFVIITNAISGIIISKWCLVESLKIDSTQKSFKIDEYAIYNNVEPHIEIFELKTTNKWLCLFDPNQSYTKMINNDISSGNLEKSK